MIKNVAVGESEVFVLKNGTDADVSTVDFLSNSIIKHGLDYLSVLELGKKKLLFYLFRGHSISMFFFVRHSTEYETSNSDRKVIQS